MFKKRKTVANALSVILSVLLTVILVANVWADGTLSQPQKGLTCVMLDDDFVSALIDLDVAPGAIKPAKLRKGKLCLPVTGGGINLEELRGEIFHSGGLGLTKDETEVELTTFIIDTTDLLVPIISGLVSQDGSFVGRAPLFDLGLDDSEVKQKRKRLTISNVELTLSSVAAEALNAALGSSFTGGETVGTASVTVRFLKAFDDDDDSSDDDDDDSRDDDDDSSDDDD